MACVVTGVESALDLADGFQQPAAFGFQRGDRLADETAVRVEHALRLERDDLRQTVDDLVRILVVAHHAHLHAEPQITREERRGARIEDDMMVRGVSRGVNDPQWRRVEGRERRRERARTPPGVVPVQLHPRALAQRLLGERVHPHWQPRGKHRSVARVILVPMRDDAAARLGIGNGAREIRGDMREAGVHEDAVHEIHAHVVPNRHGAARPQSNATHVVVHGDF